MFKAAKKGRRLAIFYTSTLIFSYSPLVKGGELELTPTLSSKIYAYDTKLGVEDASDGNQAISFVPTLSGNYTSKFFESSLFFKYTNIKQTSDQENADKSFNDFQYNGRLALYENMLSLDVSSNISNRSISQRQGAVVDEILSPSELTKLRQNTASLNFTTPNPEYLRVQWRATYSTSKSDAVSDLPTTNLENDNILFQGRISEGRQLDRTSWDISISENKTTREALSDFNSTVIRGSFSTEIYGDLRLVVKGNLEEYDVDASNAGNFGNRINTKGYGTGLEWHNRSDRRLIVTYNELEEDSGTKNFVGAEVDWAFSNRTALQFEYGKRFFGDTFNLNVAHNLKSLRANLSYSEDVTSFSRLTLTTESLGVFVCPLGSTELTDCFQPDSLQYVLRPGEEFRSASQTSPDIDEQVFLRKQGLLGIGYEKRKIRASANLSYSKTSYLESNDEQTNKRAGFSISYAMTRKTNINMSTSFTKGTFGLNEEEDKTKALSVTLVKKIGRRLELDFALRYLDRQSEEATREVTDKRMTVGVNYRF